MNPSIHLADRSISRLILATGNTLRANQHHRPVHLREFSAVDFSLSARVGAVVAGVLMICCSPSLSLGFTSMYVLPSPLSYPSR